jgi:hypothetical protein
MVEIKHDSPALMTSSTGPERDAGDQYEDSKYRLLCSLRSYVHPTGMLVTYVQACGR